MKNKKYVLTVIWLLFAAAAGLYVMYANGMNLVNSDDAGEMILAKLLSEGKRDSYPGVGLFFRTAGD